MREPALIGAGIAAILVGLIKAYVAVPIEVELALTTVVIFVVGIVVRQLVTPVSDPVLPLGVAVNGGAAIVKRNGEAA